MGFTCPSANLFRPAVGAIERLGRADVFAKGSAAATSCERPDNWEGRRSGSLFWDESPSELEVGGVSRPSIVDCEFDADCRPPSAELLGWSWLYPTADDMLSKPHDS